MLKSSRYPPDLSYKCQGYSESSASLSRVGNCISSKQISHGATKAANLRDAVNTSNHSAQKIRVPRYRRDSQRARRRVTSKNACIQAINVLAMLTASYHAQFEAHSPARRTTNVCFGLDDSRAWIGVAYLHWTSAAAEKRCLREIKWLPAEAAPVRKIILG